MTSRRPMARSFSGNGRTGSFSEEEGGSSNGRSEGRNTYLSNVRPENSYSRYSHYRPTRSTLCSVMAQLTEDIQPCFETTLKSKAVSENCNVKFTCVVSGYPAPELKWYKDDMEMDRYCGLPKYEIHRNGKNHTLHIYNCTLDDAAIYQVSASNSKGIVSCSGVLEVGTMNEYEIHQRFFAKLKQKAENKKRELEASKKKDKEKVRQVPIPPPEERPAVQEPEAVEQLGAATVEPNGVSAEAPVISANNDVDKVETAATRSPSKKKIKISNGVNAEVSSSSSSGSNSRNHTMGNGGENSYDGGIGLAQFLAETLSSQASEEKHNSLRAEKPTEMDTSIGSANKEKEREQERKQKEREEKEREKAQAAEYEREKRREQQLVIEKEKERERQLELSHKVKGHSKAHKDHDHHHIQASLSSVLHSVKDFFFGKGKKDSHDHRENEEREVDHPHDHPQPQTPPLFRLQPEHHPEVYKPLTEEAVPMEMDKPEEPPVPVDTERQSASPGPLTPHEHEHEDSVLHTQDLPPAHKLPPETEDADEAVKAMEVSVEVDRSGPGQALPMPVLPVLTENPDKMTLNITENSPSTLHEAVMPTEVTTNVLSLSKTTEDNIVTETLKSKPPIDTRIEPYVPVEDLQRDKSSVERLGVNTPTLPPLSPASLRRFLSKAAPGSDPQPVIAVPAITVGDSQSDKTGEELSGGSTPTSSLSCESSPRLKRRDSLSLIRSATPEELASGARRKIFMPRTKSEDGDGLGVVPGALDTQVKKETPYMSPSQARRAALLQAPTAQHTPPMERRSPLLSRRKATLEVPKVVEETPTDEPASVNPEDKPAEKEKLDPFKAPQVIRKIRGEPFPDASGHLKLWCQFFNVLSDSTIKWYRDEEEIIEVKRSGGDESQVALAVVQASSEDCAVYGCSITNQYGTDTTDFLLSVDILSEILLKDDFEVGEEIEMTPMLFTKGLAESGSWGDKFFGRIMTEQAHIGEGPAHKASRVKVIYGLDPVFESGSPCIIKIQSPIAYGTKEEQNLPERNLAITKQECKIQNTIREYCKIFAAEARVIENFGCSLEVVPQYLMYRPANSVPYATVEAEMNGVFLKYCMMDTKGRLINRTTSEVEQKCSTFQHWIHQWTHGNLLVIRLEGVQTKLTNVRVVTKSKGYQGLTECGSPKVFEQFLSHHQCNYYCGLLSLRPLKTMDSLQQPTKIKGSRSPLINRKLSTGSSSPQLQRKSPQISRKGTCSPKVPRKAQEAEDNKVSGVKPKPAETLDVVQMR
ncbi:alpha-protein kinase 3 [Diretmus argenteus]